MKFMDNDDDDDEEEMWPMCVLSHQLSAWNSLPDQTHFLSNKAH